MIASISPPDSKRDGFSVRAGAGEARSRVSETSDPCQSVGQAPENMGLFDRSHHPEPVSLFEFTRPGGPATLTSSSMSGFAS